MVPVSTVRNDKGMASVARDDVRMFAWTGKEKRILVYPVDYGKEFNVTCTHPAKMSDHENNPDDDSDAVGKRSTIPVILFLRSSV